jgi:hypothetical protein
VLSGKKNVYTVDSQNMELEQKKKGGEDTDGNAGHPE